MTYTTTVIIGAGQSGLAMAKHLADRSIDHVLIERGEVANSWRKERWDSLRLLTPNWMARLPGFAYQGDDPDGYMKMGEVVDFIEDYAGYVSAPIHTNTTVTSVRPTDYGYEVETDNGVWRCQSVVLANGACNIANIPRIAEALPDDIASITPMDYRNPDQLDPGGVMIVGAAATGVQLAQEIQASGRQVTLCVGEHVRVPRVYRGRDIKWWMDETGIMDMHYTEADDLTRVRNLPSLQLVGSPERNTIDINSLRSQGVEIVGRMAGIRDGKAMFSGGLNNVCSLADLKMNRLLNTIDEWANEQGLDGEVDVPHRLDPTDLGGDPPLGLDLTDGRIKTVLWATGYRPDYSWLDVPVLDRKGRIKHDGGVVTEAPGLYLLGLPFLRRRKSSFIDGADQDARDLANHLYSRLAAKAA